MSMRLVVGVNRRGYENLGPMILFEGEMLADQYIDALLRATWKHFTSNDYRIKVGDDAYNARMRGGWDRFYQEEIHGEERTYYKTTHRLWNQVPADVFLQNIHYDDGRPHDETLVHPHSEQPVWVAGIGNNIIG